MEYMAVTKYMRCIDEKRKTFQIQKETIKKALTSVDSGYKNKRIVFEERTVNDEVEENQIKKSSLFNDSSDDNNEDDDFKIRSQFEGEKGQKLLQLQTKYANDKRFTLDERFYESEDDSTKENADKTESGGDLEEEKKRQLEILANVLGHGIPVSQSKNKNSGTPMLRFDPSKPDHAKFEKQIAPKTKLKAINSIPDLETDVKEKKKKKKEANEDEVRIPVSNETFYVVKDVLTEYLQKKEKGKEMSLLELYGRKDEGELEGRRRRGRPGERWFDDVEEDLRKIGVRCWRWKAKDRDRWRRVIKEAKDLHGL
ncbi:hypothetical protein C0J52_07590 [Blattella germanica]|nr:hypothetical protein C0J52_07590 [Blattella germanica]